MGISVGLIGKALLAFRGRIQLRKDCALPLGVFRPLGLGIRTRQAKVNSRIVGRKFACGLKFLHRGFDLPQFQQSATQQFVCSGRLRIEFHGLSAENGKFFAVTTERVVYGSNDGVTGWTALTP